MANATMANATIKPKRPLGPADIRPLVLAALDRAKRDARGQRIYMTAHQILRALPLDVRRQLLSERGRPGAGSHNIYAASSLIARVAVDLEKRGEVQVSFLDVVGVLFQLDPPRPPAHVTPLTIKPSGGSLAIYRRA